MSFDVHDRFRVEKAPLYSLHPDEKRVPSQKERGIVKKWIAARYVRPAFPDAFNKRLETQRKRLKHLLEGEPAKDVVRIFIAGAEKELAQETPYRVKVILAYEGFPLETASSLEEQLESCLADCDKIEVEDIRSLSLEDITHRMTANYKWLDFDFLSLP